MSFKDLVIVDYGVGNFRNVQKAFEVVGVTTHISPLASDIATAKAIVLPGVGAFGDAINNLRQRGLEKPILRAVEMGKPLLGICVGMQLLLEESDEMGTHRGLGLIPGRVTRFPAGLTVPHMGWNQIDPASPHPLFNHIASGDFAYFAHSYICVPENKNNAIAYTDYHGQFVNSVAEAHVFGIQFHPEKSRRVGLQILKNFANLVNH